MSNDNKTYVSLPEAPKVYVVEMTEEEYGAVINLLANDPSRATDSIYERMFDAR